MIYPRLTSSDTILPMSNESISGTNPFRTEPGMQDDDPIFDDAEIDSGAEINRIISEIRTALLDPEFDKDKLRELWIQYARQTEKRVEQFLDPIEYAKAQISAILYKAMIFREAGDLFRCLEELYDAEDYALGAGFEDIHQQISEQIDLITDELDQKTPDSLA